MAVLVRELWLLRHGETEWSRTGRHTGRSDVPLTLHGEAMARALRGSLRAMQWDAIWVSPLRRAQQTCALAGLGEKAQPKADLMEWDYGQYEGKTLAEIRAAHPDWMLWREGAPGGESVEQVATRADRVLAEVVAEKGRVLLVAHGHLLRMLTTRALGLGSFFGEQLSLDPTGLSQLNWVGEGPGFWSMRRWNHSGGAAPPK